MTSINVSPQLEQLLEIASRLHESSSSEALLLLVEQRLDWERVRALAGTVPVLVAADDDAHLAGADEHGLKGVPLDVAGLRIDVRGTDDPHIQRDQYDLVAGPYDADADLRLGVTHAPYRRVIDAMEADGADLVIAGHTHGGQLCVPFWGALVTNCDLPTAQAKGLSRVGGADLAGEPGRGGADGRGAFLHVSAGLGTSPFAPVRFACPPEATLLTLTVV